MYLPALWQIIPYPYLVCREAKLKRTQGGVPPAPHIFPASVGVAPAIFADRYCRSGSFCNPKRAM